MIRIKCPFCGDRDHSEFTYGRDASVHIPELGASKELWLEAVFLRENIDGVQYELWHHVHGCRLWLIVARNTINHEISSVKLAHHGIGRILEAEETRILSDEDYLP
tara:strand:+ start:1547 stop:1864 length:318 start_codon:yes stop_codon:yes gene_type:complete